MNCRLEDFTGQSFTKAHRRSRLSLEAQKAHGWRGDPAGGDGTGQGGNSSTRAFEGPLTATISASALQLHPCCRMIADEAAAARLANRSYYDFVFLNEPEWTPYRDPGFID